MNSLVLVANAGEGTISTLRVDGESLETLTVSPCGAGAGSFVVDHARDLVHVATTDAVVTLRLDRDTGRLAEVGRIGVEDGLVSVDLAHDGTVLLGVSYNGHHAAAWPVTDGVVGERVARFEHANAHCVFVSGDVAHVASLGDDVVAQYRVGADASLAPLEPATVEAPKGSGPRHIVVDGTNAYLVTEFSAEVIRFDVAPDGTLTKQEAVRFDDPEQDLAHSRFGADPRAEHLRWGADVHRAGNWVLASERTGSTIAVIALDEDGHLGAPASFTPVPTQPRGFCVSPDGRLVLAVGELSTDTVLYRLGDDGALVELSRAQVGTKARWARFV